MIAPQPFDRILVPTDLTGLTDAAMAQALLFQKTLGSNITLLHAAEISWLTAEHPIGYYLDNVPEAKAELQVRLGDFASRYQTDGRVIAIRFADDQPGHAILAAAEDLDAGLVIMSTHGRHGVKRAMLGSVTERVLRETRRPVMTVGPAATAEPRIRTVLCPVNFTTVARVGLEAAAAVAQLFEAQLIVMHVIEGEPPLQSHVNEEFAAWVDPLVRDRTRYEQTVLHGNVAVKIVETASMIGASLIVIGAEHKLLGDRSVIGSSTARVIRAATQPVLTVVRPPAFEARRAA